MLEVKLNGLAPTDFVAREPISIDVRNAGTPPPGAEQVPPVRIVDARAVQAVAGGSESAFFADHGFVLLDHRTQVRDWELDPVNPDDSDLGRFYMGEIEAVIRERLFPGRKVLVFQRPMLLRRGEGTSTPFYGTGVHQDFALTIDDYRFNLAAFTDEDFAARWRVRYDQDDVDGFLVINFWRTTNMAGPLEHMPLAVCDPASVDAADIVQFEMRGIAPEERPTRQMGLRYGAGHRWYYYSGMTGDEMLAFKIFQRMKADDGTPLATCFHSAFEHPETPADAQKRQSCEHRVSVFLLKD